MILVTCATGHIGNVLVRQLLARQHKVRALVLPGEDLAPLADLEVEIVQGDVLTGRLPAFPTRAPAAR